MIREEAIRREIFTGFERSASPSWDEGGSRGKRRKRKTEARRRREEMIEEAPCIRLLVSGAATYDFIGCLPLHRLDESKI